ncbi:ABC transporter ATP-binding protein [Bacillaceae bacterium Marseille-Q3522]|nr:ABC transporter ATP-binding protein [Bacillaceae bacterium Marseille-Q3522]
MNDVQVKDVSFSYQDGQPVLNDISIRFQQEATAIIGQNGAGKTTFVKLLKGLLKPANGDILINGVNTKDVTAATLAKTIGLVFQNPSEQLFKTKLIDEVMFGALQIGKAKDEAYENAKKALQQVNLGNKHDVNPYDLSLVERKLAAIASILSMNPQIIIFDEPTFGQDEYGKKMIQSIMQELQANGKLVLTIIHDMDFVAETFLRTVVFQEGKVVMDDATRAVFAHEDLLYRAGLYEPYVTQLGKSLGFNDVLLTEQELIRKLQEAKTR